MKASEIILEYYDPAGDNHRKIKKSDTRRPRLTLRHLNKLRKVRELKKLEDGERKKFIPVMYRNPVVE